MQYCLSICKYNIFYENSLMVARKKQFLHMLCGLHKIKSDKVAEDLSTLYAISLLVLLEICIRFPAPRREYSIAISFWVLYIHSRCTYITQKGGVHLMCSLR